MKMTGEQKLAAPRRRVWEALNNPEVLKQCIPGCQSLEKETDERLKATVTIKIGPISARFAGAVTLSELDPPNSYLISGEGQAGAAGFAKGSARVTLSDVGDDTLLTYEVDAEVGGRLAQVGGAIIDATAKQLAGVFFRRFGEIVGAPKAEAIESPGVAEDVQPGVVATTSPPAAQPSIAVAPPAAQPALRQSPLLWVLSVFLAALVGYLARGAEADGSGGWIVLLVGVIIAGLALVGFEFGRRTAPAVVTLDPAVVDLILGTKAQKP
jgi:carbon monoxide dehydrogenase subunit G